MRRILLLTIATASVALGAALTAHSQIGASGSQVIVYGGQIRLAGTIPANLRQTRVVRILSLSCGFSTYTRIAEFPMPASGAYTYRTAPTISTLYSVRAGDIEAAKLNVRVRPQVTLTKVSGGKFRADVTSAGGTTFGGKTILFERAKSAKGPWTRLSSPKLKHTSSPTALNAVASASSPRLAAGSFVRARFAPASARPCYDGGASAAARA